LRCFRKRCREAYQLACTIAPEKIQPAAVGEKRLGDMLINLGAVGAIVVAAQEQPARDRQACTAVIFAAFGASSFPVCEIARCGEPFAQQAV